MKENNMIDIVGIGIGPFNLSLAALLSPHKAIISSFFDKNAAFEWHPGLFLPHAEIQVSHLKDLVTLVDPTNPWSFISYLAKHKRLYRFINSNFSHVIRKEFSMYLAWVSESLSNLFFDEKIEDIDFDHAGFKVQTSRRIIDSKHLVLGSGLTPYIPDCAKPYLGKSIFHSNEFMTHHHQLKGKRVAVIGGGQSGAEIVHHLISSTAQLPDELIWVTKRYQFLSMDDSAFVNELFSPKYSHYFYGLSKEEKSPLLNQQVLTSDGISHSLLESIYQQLYILECIEKHGKFFQFLPNHCMLDIHMNGADINITLADTHSMTKHDKLVDIVILCTGYQHGFPSYLASLKHRIPLDQGQFCVEKDFSIQWDGPAQNKIYVQNAARHTHGVADPNLSLMAWRSATIINSIAGYNLYDIDNESSAIDWNFLAYSKNEEVKYVSNA